MGKELIRRAGIPDDCLDGATVQGGGAAWWPGRVPDFDVEQTLQLDPGMWRIPLNNVCLPRVRGGGAGTGRRLGAGAR